MLSLWRRCRPALLRSCSPMWWARPSCGRRHPTPWRLPSLVTTSWCPKPLSPRQAPCSSRSVRAISTFSVFTLAQQRRARRLPTAGDNPRRGLAARSGDPESESLCTRERQWNTYGDYLGSAVNRVARLRGVAHGGEIIVSAATAAIVRAALPAGCELVDIGVVELRALDHPELAFVLAGAPTFTQSSGRGSRRGKPRCWPWSGSIAAMPRSVPGSSSPCAPWRPTCPRCSASWAYWTVGRSLWSPANWPGRSGRAMRSVPPGSSRAARPGPCPSRSERVWGSSVAPVPGALPTSIRAFGVTWRHCAIAAIDQHDRSCYSVRACGRTTESESC